MATETTTQIIQENPEIEARRLALIDAVAQFTNTNLANMPPPPIMRPAYQVAGLSELQQEAAVRAREGLGAYKPYMKAGQKSLQSAEALTKSLGMQGLQSAYGATGAAEGYLSSAAKAAAAQRGAQERYQLEAAQGLRGASQAGYDAAQQAASGLKGASQFGRNVFGTTRGDLSDAAQTGMLGVHQGYGYLGGAGGMFDPSQIAPFMNPYEQQVVQQAMADIRREGEIREQGLQAQAAASGAFGGSRQAVAEQELARNVMEEQARTGGQLRMAGYQQVAQQAQQAFEQERQRRLQQAQLASGIASTGAGMALEAAKATGQLGLQAAGLQQAGAGQAGQLGMQAAGLEQAGAGQLGALGVQYGQLNQADINQMINLGQTQGALGQAYSGYGQAGAQLGAQLGQLGAQQGAMGQAAQQAALRDVQTLEALGGRDQALQQAILDAQRKTNEQLYMAPYEQYAFLSDIYKGTPSSQQGTQIRQSADPSTAQQIAGLGISGLSAAAGAKQMELF